MQGNLAEILLKMGRETALPGVELAIELLQELRADLMGGAKQKSARDYIEVEVIEPARRLGRPSGSKNGAGKGGSWGSMTAEERSREMKRRMKVARERKRKAALRAGRVETAKPKLHPRDPRHPGHDAWIAKMKRSQKQHWDSMTMDQQEARLAKMAAGKRHAA